LHGGAPNVRVKLLADIPHQSNCGCHLFGLSFLKFNSTISSRPHDLELFQFVASLGFQVGILDVLELDDGVELLVVCTRRSTKHLLLVVRYIGQLHVSYAKIIVILPS
jgi:hypothetical protein